MPPEIKATNCIDHPLNTYQVNSFTWKGGFKHDLTNKLLKGIHHGQHKTRNLRLQLFF